MRHKNMLILILLIINSGFTQLDEPPEWAKDAVWYQIFPERFYNGDPGNDPQKKDIIGAWPFMVPTEWEIAPWTMNWFQNLHWESFDDFYQNNALRRYGGDIQGIIQKLPYLKQLGITAIYLNPIFESPSHHKYDAAMYRHVDNNFGPNPDRDEEIWAQEDPADPTTWKWTAADSLFLSLIRKAHEMEIRIIIDGVFNHVGSEFWAFKDVKKNGKNSPYKNWFYINSFDDPETEKNEFDYRGWYGVKSLPELKEVNGDLIEPIRQHIFHIVDRWMDPNGDGNPEDGIDGWRLDVAEMVGHAFWKKFRRKVKSINPEAYIVGEVWWEDYQNNKIFDASPWLRTEFDAVMNYRFLRFVKNFIADKKMKINSTEFATHYNKMMKEYGKNMYVMQNLLGSHDIERFSSSIVNPDHVMDHGGRIDWNSNWKNRKPVPDEYTLMKLAVAIQMTMPGAPMIYYGDEAGMWGGDDPDCRKPMVWPEMAYENETNHPMEKNARNDKVSFDHELFAWYRKLINIRKMFPCLRRGSIKFIDTKSPDALCYLREYQEERILIIVNKANEDVELNSEELNKILGTKYKLVTDLISGEEVPVSEVKNIESTSVKICKLN